MLLQMRENYCYSKWSPYFNESYGNRLFTNFCNRSICSSGKDYVKATVAALTFYGVASELAAKAVEKGPGSFQIEFLNQLANTTSGDIEKYGKIVELE